MAKYECSYRRTAHHATARPYPSRRWHSIKRPRRDARLSWPTALVQLSVRRARMSRRDVENVERQSAAAVVDLASNDELVAEIVDADDGRDAE